MSNSTNNKELIKVIISIVFIITGAAGLIYQIVWFKYLALFLGNTTYAQMTVLSTFLGGLAIGNYYFGRKADFYLNPLKKYAILEISVGVYCLIYPMLSSFIGDSYLKFASASDLYTSSITFNVFRFLLSAILLIIPTIAMGGTLPILCKFFIDDIKKTRREMAILYFLNSFGAVWGIVFAGFILIKTFGLDATIYSTAVINVMVGLLALSLSSSIKEPGNFNAEVQDNEIELKEEKLEKKTILSLIFVAGISGAAALIYEMVWTRLLVNILGSSTYAFSVMLMAFISGITLGGFIVSQKFLNKFNKVKLLAFCQSAIALGTMLVLPVYERLPYYLWKIANLFARTETTFGIFLAIEFVLCFLLMFIPTIFMGMSLPLIVEVVSKTSKRVGLSVGKVFSVNTIGTVIGVILTGLILLQTFGIKGTFEIGIVLNLLSAIMIVLIYKNINLIKKIILSVSLFSIFIIYLITFSSWNKGVLLSGVFRDFKAKAPDTYKEFEDRFAKKNILFYEEGNSANVAVVKYDNANKTRALVINGKVDASTGNDMVTQILLAQIPMLLHSDPQNVFVIGFGSGTTIGSVLTHNVKNVTCSEISKEVIKAGNCFNKVNNSCLSDPRLHLVLEDAHTYLKLTKDKYDVIISEPSNPWIAGIANLFSKEYFELCKSKLNDDGLIVQWCHLYETSDEVVSLVFNTFHSVFPFAQVWNGSDNDIILVGSRHDITINEDAIKRRFSIPGVKSSFKMIGINNLFTVLSCQVLSPESFAVISNENPINTEKNLKLEFLAPESFYLGGTSSFIKSFDERMDSLSEGLLVKKYIKDNIPSYEEIFNAAKFHYERAGNWLLSYGFSKYLLENCNDYNSRILYYNVSKKTGMNNLYSGILADILKEYPDSLKLKLDYIKSRIEEIIPASNFFHIYSIENLFKGVPNLDKDTTLMLKTYIDFAQAFYENGEYLQALNLCKKIDGLLAKTTSLPNSFPIEQFYFLYSMNSLYMKDIETSVNSFYSMIRINPKNPKIILIKRKLEWELKDKLKLNSVL